MSKEVGSPFDAAPFGKPLDGETGVIWEDPREIHRAVVRFDSRPPEGIKLQYWQSRWPQRRLPKNQLPGGANVGWWELGNWFTGQWRTADAVRSVEGKTATFTFRPVNETEFPDLDEFPATYRNTLKLRLVSGGDLPVVEAFEAYTDSTWEACRITILRDRAFPTSPSFEAFNGCAGEVQAVSDDKYVLTLWRTWNADPNTFDKTLLTVCADEVVTVLAEDLDDGPACVPDYGICVVKGEEERDYLQVLSAARIDAPQGVYDAVADLPEQTWERAWEHMVPKREPFYLPLGTDGGRQKFGVNSDGSVFYRMNNKTGASPDNYMVSCPGRDTARLQAEPDPIEVRFDLPKRPQERTLEDGTLPIGIVAWEAGGIRTEQTAFATVLEGADSDGPPPPPDATAVVMVRFEFRNLSENDSPVALPLRFSTKGENERLRCDSDGTIWSGDRLRGVVVGEGTLRVEDGTAFYAADLKAGSPHVMVLKLPYLFLEGEEIDLLKALDFDAERKAVAGFWRRRFDQGARLLTPEPMLNEFYRSHAGHLLINCEREPDAERRFARVGSFRYGVFGNESCMMIVDLDRRGYHREAQACLNAFLHYQGSVALPGDFSSQEGVLYGTCGYECGGYNQHHGWTLWCLVEHYRFTRDRGWLKEIAPNIVLASDWIIRERARTQERDDLGRGLLPHGSLEDIGDWWQWLSTNAYTWMGLDAAAWALEEIGHSDAGRVRQDAGAYRQAILRAFRLAAQRSPVVRLRDGACVPHFPSQVHRRGRSFGWICEILEGAIHLLISRVLDADAPEALWILRDFEDNLYLSDHYGYEVENFSRHWFDWGGFSMQACLLLDAEPYLFRDDVKHALRAMFNAIAANYFPDTRMLTEHAAPRMGDWRGDHYKTSDEANAAGWLRYLFVREQGDKLLLGQAVPRAWLTPGNRVGIENASTYFGPMSLIFEADEAGITAKLHGPKRNPPARIKLRFRPPKGSQIRAVTVDGTDWADRDEAWIYLPGDIGNITVRADFYSESGIRSQEPGARRKASTD